MQKSKADNGGVWEKGTGGDTPGYRGLQNNLILLGVFFSILYWILQSLIKAYILYEGTLASQIFTGDVNELWLRSLVVFILMIFTTYVQHLFRKMRKAEEELAQTREEFVTILTHDLKAPLSSMLGYAQLIGDPRGGELTAQKQGFVREIMVSGDIMLHMINNIVNASKLKSGQIEYNLEDFSMDELIDELRHTFEPLGEMKKIILEFSCPQGTQVRGDRSKVRQIFYNLISNAFRYTPRQGRIHLHAVPNGSRVDIEVGDTGKGIPPSEQDKIFRKFDQVKGERQGTGLGLYIVKSFLQGHGSDIRIDSAPEKGTRFFFALPAGTPLQG